MADFDPCRKTVGQNAAGLPFQDRQQDDIDMNCGSVVDEGADIGALGRQFYEQMIRCASGEYSKSETYGYGQNEFVPWQLSVVT